MNWDPIVNKVTPSVVRIETPHGHGTGFFCLCNEARTICGIATAHHVIDHADVWQDPIRIIHASGTAFLPEQERVIFKDQEKDSAVVLIPASKLKFPEKPIALLPTESRLPIGTDVGWLGYPAMGPHTLCFFSGNVSAWQDFRNAYLIDGVAINGVSGGPVFIHSPNPENIQIVGAIAAYMPNRASGNMLPGLSVAQDVSHFHDITLRIRSMDEAKKQKSKEEEQASASRG
jgi:hypothetical protein